MIVFLITCIFLIFFIWKVSTLLQINFILKAFQKKRLNNGICLKCGNNFKRQLRKVELFSFDIEYICEYCQNKVTVSFDDINNKYMINEKYKNNEKSKKEIEKYKNEIKKELGII